MKAVSSSNPDRFMTRGWSSDQVGSPVASTEANSGSMSSQISAQTTLTGAPIAPTCFSWPSMGR